MYLKILEKNKNKLTPKLVEGKKLWRAEINETESKRRSMKQSVGSLKG
jgi:hypothetical protein